MNILTRRVEMMAHGEHTPVLLAESLAGLAPFDGGLYVDATFGAGGFTRAILDSAACRVFAVDRDAQAAEIARDLAHVHKDRLTAIEGRFGDLEALMAEQGVSALDGVVFDLGVSSPQIDVAERGFSFRHDGPLDMRMGSEGTTAAELVNTLCESELARIIFTYGEERAARRVARAIGAARAVAPIERTSQLVEVVRSVVPRGRDGIDPATRTFQALRIFVNDEIGELERGLIAAERLLAPGGRLAVISFHSLEDRTVKDFLRRRAIGSPGPSRHQPISVNEAMGQSRRQPSFRLVSRRPIGPSEPECMLNPRARSAKLRIAERTSAPAMAPSGAFLWGEVE